MQQNKLAEASKALVWLRGKGYDPSNELSEIQASVKQKTQPGEPQLQGNKVSRLLLWLRKRCQKKVIQSIFAAMLRTSSVKALSISYGLFICQQMCGINILTFYTADIFEVSPKSISVPHGSLRKIRKTFSVIK